MIRINLLAPDAIKKEERNDLLVIAYVALAILACGAAAYYGVHFSACRSIESRLSRTQQELAKYEEIVRQVDALQATKRVLETKKNVIQSLMNGGLAYPRFMEKIVELMPSSVAFKTMTTTLANDGKITVAMTAESFDNYAIADFVAALLADRQFAAVELGQIVATNLNKTSLANFNLSFQYMRKAND